MELNSLNDDRRAKIKHNISTIVHRGGDEKEIEKYLSAEGVTREQLVSQKDNVGFWGEIKQDFKENWPQYAGATGGAILGTAGGPAGMVAGAAIGGAGGQAYKQIYQHAVGDEDAPQTSLEAAKRIGTSGLVEGATEVVGGAVARAGGKLLRPFSKYVTKEARVAIDTLSKHLPKKSLVYLPAETTEHRGLDILHNFAEGSFFGGRRIFYHKNYVRKEAIDKMVDELAETFGGKADPDVLGNAVVDIAQKKYKAFKETITAPLYNRAETLAQNVSISLKPLKDSVKDHVGMKIGGAASGDNIVNAIRELPDTVDFTTAKELRSRILDEVSKVTVENPKARAVRVGTKLRNALDDIIDKELSTQSPDAHTIWREANRLYKEGAAKYNNKFIRTLIKQSENEPERVLKSIFKNGGVTGLSRVRGIVGETTWKKLKGWYLRDILSKSTTNGITNGDRLLEKMFSSKAGGMGEAGIKRIFSNAEVESIKSVATALKVAYARQGEGQGKMLVQLMQGSALVGLGAGLIGETSGITNTSLGILIAPEILARIMTNPTGARWLSTGLKAPKYSNLIPSTIARLSTMATRIQKQLEKENEN